MSLPHCLSAEAETSRIELPIPPNSPNLDLTSPAGQDNILLATNRRPPSAFVTESKALLRRLLKHGWYCLVLFIQLCLLPLMVLFRRHWMIQEWLLLRVWPNELEDTPANSLLQKVIWLWLQAVDVARMLVELYQRLDQIADSLEEHCDTRRGRICATSIRKKGSQLSLNLSDTPLTLPTTASQVYHAALVDNRTLDDLLASFDGKDVSIVCDNGVGQEQSQLEVASGSENLTECSNNLRSSSISFLETPARGSKFSVKASPFWAKRLGFFQNIDGLHAEHDIGDNAYNSLVDDVASQQSTTPPSTRPRKDAIRRSISLDVVRCMACDSPGHVFGQSVKEKEKINRKLNFEKLPDSFSTVTMSKRSSIPKMRRPKAMRP